MFLISQVSNSISTPKRWFNSLWDSIKLVISLNAYIRRSQMVERIYFKKKNGGKNYHFYKH